MRAVLTPEAARTALGAVIRYELREAWERGLETAPRHPNALADVSAPQSYDAITLAVDAYMAAIDNWWRRRRGCPPISGGDVSRETSQPDDGWSGNQSAGALGPEHIRQIEEADQAGARQATDGA